jgi:hypothetical protein
MQMVLPKEMKLVLDRFFSNNKDFLALNHLFPQGGLKCFADLCDGCTPQAVSIYLNNKKHAAKRKV